MLLNTKKYSFYIDFSFFFSLNLKKSNVFAKKNHFVKYRYHQNNNIITLFSMNLKNKKYTYLTKNSVLIFDSFDKQLQNKVEGGY